MTNDFSKIGYTSVVTENTSIKEKETNDMDFLSESFDELRDIIDEGAASDIDSLNIKDIDANNIEEKLPEIVGKADKALKKSTTIINITHVMSYIVPWLIYLIASPTLFALSLTGGEFATLMGIYATGAAGIASVYLTGSVGTKLAKPRDEDDDAYVVMVDSWAALNNLKDAANENKKATPEQKKKAIISIDNAIRTTEQSIMTAKKKRADIVSKKSFGVNMPAGKDTAMPKNAENINKRLDKIANKRNVNVRKFKLKV